MERKKGIMLSYNAPDRGYIWLDPIKNVLKNCVEGIWRPIASSSSDERIDEIAAEQERLIREFGNISTLKTSNKNNLVAALNEVYDKFPNAPANTEPYVLKSGKWEPLKAYTYTCITNQIPYYIYSQTLPRIPTTVPMYRDIDFTDRSRYQEDGYMTNDGFGRGTGYFEGINFQTSLNGSFMYHSVKGKQGLFNLGPSTRTLEILCPTTGDLVILGSKLDEGITVEAGLIKEASSDRLVIVPQYDGRYVTLKVPRISTDMDQYITQITITAAKTYRLAFNYLGWDTYIKKQQNTPLWMSMFVERDGGALVVWTPTLIHQGVAEAPKDGNPYVRKDGNWDKLDVQPSEGIKRISFDEIDDIYYQCGIYMVYHENEAAPLADAILQVYTDSQIHYVYQRLTSQLVDPNSDYDSHDDFRPAKVWQRRYNIMRTDDPDVPQGTWSQWTLVDDGLAISTIGDPETLQTQSKTIVGAINELYSMITALLNQLNN